MRTIYIPAKSRSKINKSKILEVSGKIPKNIAIAYSIQYKHVAEEIKQLLRDHKITSFIQVLGCSNPKLPKQTQAILLIGNGKFHATSIAYETQLPVFLLDHSHLSKISKADIEMLGKKKKLAYMKFLHEDIIGILVTTKPGQQNVKRALDLKKKLKKKSYLFISNEINPNEFQNFGLNSWVNTACPRLDLVDNSIINMQDLG